MQLASSFQARHASWPTGGCTGQLHTHASHSSPGGHAGHAHVHVSPLSHPLGGGVQSQVHGGHISPGRQAGQAHPHVPPPLPPPPEGGGVQSQAHGGQSSPAGQASGQAHTQLSSGRVVQKPPSSWQSAVVGQKRSNFAHMHAASASQLDSPACALHGSTATQTRFGQAPPDGHGSATPTTWQSGSSVQNAIGRATQVSPETYAAARVTVPGSV